MAEKPVGNRPNRLMCGGKADSQATSVEAHYIRNRPCRSDHQLQAGAGLDWYVRRKSMSDWLGRFCQLFPNCCRGIHGLPNDEFAIEVPDELDKKVRSLD